MSVVAAAAAAAAAAASDVDVAAFWGDTSRQATLPHDDVKSDYGPESRRGPIGGGEGEWRARDERERGLGCFVMKYWERGFCIPQGENVMDRRKCEG